MNTEQKIQAIKQAIEKAEKRQSKLLSVNFDVPALASLQIRHLLNNLGELSTHYLECGPHKGGSFTSSISHNNLLSVTAIDSFESDHMDGETAKIQFLNNVEIHCPKQTKFKLIQSDCFTVDLGQIENKIDLYLYDAGHSEDDQRQALTYYYPILADEFILCVDDYDLPEVKIGTEKGIKEMNLEVLFEETLIGNDHDNESWWRGYYVALLKKTK